MGILVSINRVITPPAEAKVSVFDRGFLYGDSVFETVRTYAARPFQLKAHLVRLGRSATPIGLSFPYDVETIAGEVRRVIEAAVNPESVVRIIVTRGEGTVALLPSPDLKPNLIVIVRPHQDFTDDVYEKGVELAVVATRRNARLALDPNIKSGNYLNNVLALREAAAAGAFEAVMLNPEGLVTEGTTSNVFMVKDGKLATPHERAGLLRGITRELVLYLAREQGIPLAERDISETELRGAVEIFVTSTLKEVLPVTRLNGKPVSNGAVGPVTRKLQEAFREVVRRFVASGEEPALVDG